MHRCRGGWRTDAAHVMWGDEGGIDTDGWVPVGNGSDSGFRDIRWMEGRRPQTIGGV